MTLICDYQEILMFIYVICETRTGNELKLRKSQYMSVMQLVD